MVFSLSLLVFLAYGSTSFAANVAIMAQFGQSHYLIMEKLAEELTSRGHEVSILVGEDSTYATGRPNVKAFAMPQEALYYVDGHVKAMTGSKKQLSMIEQYNGLFRIQKIHCDIFFNSTTMMDELKNADVLIGDSLYLCSSLAADKYDIPHVVIQISPVNTFTLEALGISCNPAYIPAMGSALPLDMNFLDRLTNLGFYLMNQYVMYGVVYPTYKSIKEKYGISPDKTIFESLSTVDIVILSGDYILNYPLPVPPFVKDVGFFLTGPAIPLPAELEEFMQSSGDEGVVLLSFGSMVLTVDTQATHMMMKAFARMPQKFLLKLDIKNLKEGSIPPNVKAVKWVPQNDILGHTRTKLFITHAGVNGLAEAAYHGIPMLCSPFFGDQYDNAQYAKDIGIAEILSVTSATEDELVNVLNTLLREKRYKDKVARVSKVLKLRKRTPLQDAANLVEYVSQGHMDHLKPRGASLPFYQFYMLDVMLVLGVALLVVLTMAVFALRYVASMCSKVDTKKKTE